MSRWKSNMWHLITALLQVWWKSLVITFPLWNHWTFAAPFWVQSQWKPAWTNDPGRMHKCVTKMYTKGKSLCSSVPISQWEINPLHSRWIIMNLRQCILQLARISCYFILWSKDTLALFVQAEISFELISCLPALSALANNVTMLFCYSHRYRQHL